MKNSALNVEEDLLGMEETVYPEVAENSQALIPYATLWETASNFLTKSEEWQQSLFKAGLYWKYKYYFELNKVRFNKV